MNRVIRWLKPLLLGASCLFTVWALWLGGESFVRNLLAGYRVTFYSTLASLSATLLGSAIAVVSIILLYSSNARLSYVVQQGQFPPLIKVFFDAIWALGATTLVAIFGLLIDRETAPAPFAFCLCVICIAWTTATLARCIHVFQKVIGIVTAPSKARRGDRA